jgi:hypothetical protein
MDLASLLEGETFPTKPDTFFYTTWVGGRGGGGVLWGLTAKLFLTTKGRC